MENVLRIENLTKHYPAFTLDNVSFSVDKGRIMGFIGRNGAGKSTTLKAMLNFVHKDGGEIEFFGKQFEGNEDEIKQNIGYVSGGIDYYTKKKIKTITDVTKRFYKNWDDAAYKKYMTEFALDENKTPDQLSAGMKVKYALTLALSHNAEFLILDEPTSGLDPVSRDDLLDVFLSLADRGVTILFSTHITSDLDKCADDITYIKNGKIFASEDMKTFIGRYVVAELQNEEMTDEIKGAIEGHRRTKEGFTVLLDADKAAELNIKGEKADLEQIIVHIEKEAE